MEIEYKTEFLFTGFPCRQVRVVLYRVTHRCLILCSNGRVVNTSSTVLQAAVSIFSRGQQFAESGAGGCFRAVAVAASSVSLITCGSNYLVRRSKIIF